MTNREWLNNKVQEMSDEELSKFLHLEKKHGAMNIVAMIIVTFVCWIG